ncbi:MAG: DUF6754 domain-containing protein [Chloroflexota bacterium]
MEPATQTLTVLVIIFVFALVAIASPIVGYARRRAVRRGIDTAAVSPLKPLSAYDLIPTLVAQSIEADRPILFSTGAGALGDGSTITTLAGTGLMYYITQRVTIGATPPLFLTSDTSVIPLGYDILRRAYFSQGQRGRIGVNNVRWYPSGIVGDRSLVFAAMLTATMSSDDPAGAVFVGRFNEELALPLLDAQRRGVPSIAGSDTIIGQAVAYAMADGALIGENLYSAGGYLGEKATDRGTLGAQDALRGVVIFIIIVIAVNTASDGQLVTALFNLIGR